MLRIQLQHVGGHTMNSKLVTGLLLAMHVAATGWIVCCFERRDTSWRLLRGLFEMDGGVPRTLRIAQAGLQATYLLCTLVPVRLWAYNQHKEPTDETSTCPAPRRADVPDTA